MKIIFTDDAKADLDEITAYIAQDNRSRAISFVRELRISAQMIPIAPRANPLIERYAKLGIRRRVYGNYLIFYRINADQIVIIRVLHAARDYERLLDAES